jgi:lipopolysaccharide transport system ATP-binding protein
MCSELAIDVRNLSKVYHTYSAPADRLKQAIVSRLQAIARPIVGRHIKFSTPKYYAETWALHPISFQISKTETFAIIGRNGSGKSTLMQLVCGTANSTSGEVSTFGRVGALLELGSGFNPEYTGRENIYLNASVLGFSRAKTDERLNDIISFADIGDFIDRPVKTYSSGMTMRLAFSVIAHVDCEILVVDEALAVGDAYFQQKCLRWLREFQKRGTVLFCSHDVGAVLSLCTRAIWIDAGRVMRVGHAREVCEAYNAFIHQLSAGTILDQGIGSHRQPDDGAISPPEPDQPGQPDNSAPQLPSPPADACAVFDLRKVSRQFGTGMAEVLDGNLFADDNSQLVLIEGGERVRLTIKAQARADLTSVIVGFIVKDRLGQSVFGDNTLNYAEHKNVTIGAGQLIIATFRFVLPMLAAGRYSITLAIATGSLENHVQQHWLHDALFFDVSSKVGGVIFALPSSTCAVAMADSV